MVVAYVEHYTLILDLKPITLSRVISLDPPRHRKGLDDLRQVRKVGADLVRAKDQTAPVAAVGHVVNGVAGASRGRQASNIVASKLACVCVCVCMCVCVYSHALHTSLLFCLSLLFISLV